MRLSVLGTPLDEGWPSMDLVAEQLVGALVEIGVEARLQRPPMARLARRLPGMAPQRALNVDRLVHRFVAHPSLAALGRWRADAFHVADQSYAQLLHALPPDRSRICCHDLDAFRSVLEPERDPRPRWFRALVRVQLAGLRRAALIFTDSRAVRDELLGHRLAAPERVVHAPLGLASEFRAVDDAAPPLPTELQGRRYLFHVGLDLPRKRLDLVYRTALSLRERFPELLLVQRGARASEDVRRAFGGALIELPKLDRRLLAAIYRNAALVLFPSDDEGFGVPVVEALGTGAVVLCSDLPVLRETGGDVALYAPPGNLPAFVQRASALLASEEPAPAKEARLAWAARFSWTANARTVAEAYRALPGVSR